MVTPDSLVAATLPFAGLAVVFAGFLVAAAVASITGDGRVLRVWGIDLAGDFAAGLAAGLALTAAFRAGAAGLPRFAFAAAGFAVLMALAALAGALRAAAGAGLRALATAFLAATLAVFPAPPLVAAVLALVAAAGFGLAAFCAGFALPALAVPERAAAFFGLLPAFGFCFDFAISVLTL